MKKLLYIFSVVFIIMNATTSCDRDFLNLYPTDQYSDGVVWNDPLLTEAFVNNIYMSMSEGFGGYYSFLTDESMSGNISPKYVNATIGPTDFNNFQLAFLDIAVDYYKNIRACNSFIEHMASSTIDTDLKNQLMGEVYFLRAYIYFQLVFHYGGVPIIDKTYGMDEDYLAQRNTFEECINFITSDCDLAASLLGVSDKGRATPGAALALKARTLLFAASDLYNSGGSWAGGYAYPELIGYVEGDRTARWQDAKDAAKAVIDLGIYSLYKPNPASLEEASQNYSKIFLLKETSEDIMVHFYSLTLGDWYGANNPGIYLQPNGWHCWSVTVPTQKLVDAYGMSDGTKFDWNNPVHAAHPYENRDPRFYASILYDGSQWRNRPNDVKAIEPYGIVQTGATEKWNATTGTIDLIPGVDTRHSPIEDWNGTWTSYNIKKFMDPAFDAALHRQDTPWRYFRYAEVLLNYAEACLGLSQEDEAKTYINMIRKRAGLPDITETGSALVDRFRNERFIELAMEDLRYYDIRRWMIGSEAYVNAQGMDIIHKLNPDHITTTAQYTIIKVQDRAWNDKCYFIPIGLDEMNKNKNLIQNPLY